MDHKTKTHTNINIGYNVIDADTTNTVHKNFNTHHSFELTSFNYLRHLISTSS